MRAEKSTFSSRRRLGEPRKIGKIGWDGRVAVTEATGPNITVDGVTYQLLGKDATGSPVYQDVEVLKEQKEFKQREEAEPVSQEKTSTTENGQESVENPENRDKIKPGIQFFAEKTIHADERIEQRQLSEAGVDDALANPLYKGEVIEDAVGRKSVKYIGKDVTVIWNPDSNEVITAWKTGTRIRRKYGGD